MNINLHIERLVLDGVNIAPGQRHLLQTSVEIELMRMLMDAGLASRFAQGASVPRVSTDSIDLAAGDNPMQLGRQIAQSVYGGIGHE